VPRRSTAIELADMLDSPEISGLIAELEGTRWTGRPGYPIRSMVGMALAKSLYALPTWTKTVALVDEHQALRETIAGDDEVPSVFACYRFSKKLRDFKPMLLRCTSRVIQALKARDPEMGRDLAIDGSDLPAYANGQRYISKGGPERKRFSDPEASWGHRSAVSTRSRGGYYGFKLHAAVCTRTGLPVAWEVASARDGEALFVADLIEEARARGLAAATCAMDKGYDVGPVYDALEQRRCAPVIPLRKTLAVRRGDHLLAHNGPPTRLHPRIPRDSERFGALYRARSAIEREFGRLKHEWAMLPLRVRGLQRVRLHVDLTILTKLTRTLCRMRATPMTA
jgi:Transposase DDE domain/Transposase domain (DUF772)